MSKRRYPEVYLQRQKSYTIEPTHKSVQHFSNKAYYRYLMLMELAAFDSFVANATEVLEDISPARDAVELRSFKWAGRQVQMLSCAARHSAIMATLVLYSHLQGIEPEPPFVIRQGVKKVAFPYPAINVVVLMPRGDKRR